MSWYDQALASWYRSKEESADALGRGISSFGDSIGSAIQRAGQDRTANQLSSQLANSGNYAPRGGLVSPGIDPITGAINTIKAGTPESVATQGGVVGMVPQTRGTAPVVATGGEQALKARLAIANAQREAQGGSAIDIALKNAQIAH